MDNHVSDNTCGNYSTSENEGADDSDVNKSALDNTDLSNNFNDNADVDDTDSDDDDIEYSGRDYNVNDNNSADYSDVDIDNSVRTPSPFSSSAESQQSFHDFIIPEIKVTSCSPVPVSDSRIITSSQSDSEFFDQPPEAKKRKMEMNQAWEVSTRTKTAAKMTYFNKLTERVNKSFFQPIRELTDPSSSTVFTQIKDQPIFISSGFEFVYPKGTLRIEILAAEEEDENDNDISISFSGNSFNSNTIKSEGNSKGSSDLTINHVTSHSIVDKHESISHNSKSNDKINFDIISRNNSRRETISRSHINHLDTFSGQSCYEQNSYSDTINSHNIGNQKSNNETVTCHTISNIIENVTVINDKIKSSHISKNDTVSSQDINSGDNPKGNNDTISKHHNDNPESQLDDGKAPEDKNGTISYESMNNNSYNNDNSNNHNSVTNQSCKIDTINNHNRNNHIENINDTNNDNSKSLEKNNNNSNNDITSSPNMSKDSTSMNYKNNQNSSKDTIGKNYDCNSHDDSNKNINIDVTINNSNNHNIDSGDNNNGNKNGNTSGHNSNKSNDKNTKVIVDSNSNSVCQNLVGFQSLCLYCPMSFEDDVRLKLHIADRHNKIRPLLCKVCQLSFKRKRHLLEHQKNSHPEAINTTQVHNNVTRPLNSQLDISLINADWLKGQIEKLKNNFVVELTPANMMKTKSRMRTTLTDHQKRVMEVWYEHVSKYPTLPQRHILMQLTGKRT
jgi:hypothetical protein